MGFLNPRHAGMKPRLILKSDRNLQNPGQTKLNGDPIQPIGIVLN